MAAFTRTPARRDRGTHADSRQVGRKLAAGPIGDARRAQPAGTAGGRPPRRAHRFTGPAGRVARLLVVGTDGGPPPRRREDRRRLPAAATPERRALGGAARSALAGLRAPAHPASARA